MLKDLPKQTDDRLLVGHSGSDDAAVYRLDGGQALIQTVDFFPPVVDDPYDFGRVAAANALSDVWAMGGAPRLAMNLLAVPPYLPPEAVRAILAGGAEKVSEAGALLAGGHSIQDEEPKYGLCVTGFAAEADILKNSGARAGDLLVLTKPIGSGVLTTAAKAELLAPAEASILTETMAALNKTAWEEMMPLRPHGCTDVTGFGLVGHALEMARGSGLTLTLWAAQVPLLPGALEWARQGLLPGGCHRNRADVERETDTAPGLELALRDLLFDPQTSGGLLIALPERRAEELIRRLRDRGLTACAVGQAGPRKVQPLHIQP